MKYGEVVAVKVVPSVKYLNSNVTHTPWSTHIFYHKYLIW